MGFQQDPDFIVWKLHLSSPPRQVYQVLARHLERMPVIPSPSLRSGLRLTRSRAGSERSKGAVASGSEILRFAQDDSAALRMTGLDLSIGEELSRSFEPCLIRKYS